MSSATTKTGELSPRLIESWLPISEIGEESIRERRSMTSLPPTYYLHVWWARRPLVASRAAVLASLLPADADRDKFKHVLGIHGDPIAAKKRIEDANRAGVRLGSDAYGYSRAFSYLPSVDDRLWIEKESARLQHGAPIVLDPTAGGGSIPFESIRLGFTTHANDLNPVASLIERATIAWPVQFGIDVQTEFRRLGKELTRRVREQLSWVFPKEPTEDCRPDGYLWARTIRCPYCDGVIPLSPNWRLAPDGTGVRLIPKLESGNRRCEFEIVTSISEHSDGTVSGGDATCPYKDCQRVVDGDQMKTQAQAGQMGDQLFVIVYKQRVMTKTKGGRERETWKRGYRAPRSDDDVSGKVREELEKKRPDWEAEDILPTEEIWASSIGVKSRTNDPSIWGIRRWTDMFSARQLLSHGTSVEVFRQMLVEDGKSISASEAKRAAYGYLALSMDKLRDYNSRLTRWHGTREVMVNTFDRHEFSTRWSYAEMAPLVIGLGYDWAIDQTAKCIGELIDLTRTAGTESTKKKAKRSSPPTLPGIPAEAAPPPTIDPTTPPPIVLTCKPADRLDHVDDGTIDCVVMDPPYYDNVMYAELSDFFYVWLKRTAGYVYPELFRLKLTDKENEAVANAALFHGQKGAKERASRDYRDKMAAIFAECRRVLKPDGIMTLMFTHKATGAWDALTMGLMMAGFSITASWPINTEAESSLHIKEKSAANSTIFLVCRPRPEAKVDDEVIYWEDVEPKVRKAVRDRVKTFQEAGIRGVDLYLSCFGPALQEFSKHWPVKRGQPRPQPEERRRRKQAELFEEAFDPYATTPEDALDAARREVKRWRLEQLTHLQRQNENVLDPLTEWFVLAWDAFEAPEFAYDEALHLARVVGLDLDREVVNRLAEKKGSNLVLWDSAKRAAKGALGAADGGQSLIDAIHRVAHIGRTRTLAEAKELVERTGMDKEPGFFIALEAVLEVLPVSRAFTQIELPSAEATAAAGDFEVLENLRRLAYSDRVAQPEQLKLWQEEAKA